MKMLNLYRHTHNYTSKSYAGEKRIKAHILIYLGLKTHI